MGDITTHATIVSHVRAEVERAVPGMLTEEQFTCLELGNFLTDVSQFRDPPAMHAGRERASDEVDREVERKVPGVFEWLVKGVTWLIGRADWSTTIFGPTDQGPHGSLATVLDHLIRSITLMLFTNESAGTPIARILGVGPSWAPLSADEVNRIYDDAFTQYWPHEHFDFPPLVEPVGHIDDPELRRQPNERGVAAYLDDQLAYVAQGLAAVEHDWLASLAAGEPAAHRNDLVVRLGHLLHAVEDFWFHSNFVELVLLDRAEAAVGGAVTDSGRADEVVTRMLADAGLDTGVRMRRKLFRRLRYPEHERRAPEQLDGDGEPMEVPPRSLPSTTDSRWGVDWVYTGAFGQYDVLHTLGGALERFEDDHPTWSALLGSSPLVLLRLLASRARRAQLTATPDAAGEHADEHADQITSGTWEAWLDEPATTAMLGPEARAALRAALVEDRDRERPWSMFPGPGGILISLLGMMERERSRNDDLQGTHDEDAASVTDPASTNEATAEDVGTHTLLSKDSTTSDPFRAPAVALAKYTSSSVAVRLFQRIEADPDPDSGLDWTAFLQRWITSPLGDDPDWWSDVLDAGDTLPHVGAVASHPDAEMLAAGSPELAILRSGQARQDLEAAYRAFEDQA